MISSSPIELVIAFIVGLAVGGLFFVGLWLTVRRVSGADHPALLMTFSFMLRSGIVLAAFFLVGRGHFDRMLACSVGFLVARLVVMRVALDHDPAKPRREKEAANASQP